MSTGVQLGNNVSPLTAEALVSLLIASTRLPFRYRITGYPACGKTTICGRLAQQLPDMCHIEAEAWIYPLSFRKAHDLSGSRSESYNAAAAVHDIQSLLNGQSVSLPIYDHHLGAHAKSFLMQGGSCKSIVLDGTLFSLFEFDVLVPPCIFLRPENLEVWLEVAVRRDVEARAFSYSEATRHNMRKARDMEDILLRSPRATVLNCRLSDSGIYYYYED